MKRSTPLDRYCGFSKKDRPRQRSGPRHWDRRIRNEVLAFRKSNPKRYPDGFLGFPIGRYRGFFVVDTSSDVQPGAAAIKAAILVLVSVTTAIITGRHSICPNWIIPKMVATGADGGRGGG